MSFRFYIRIENGGIVTEYVVTVCENVADQMKATDSIFLLSVLQEIKL